MNTYSDYSNFENFKGFDTCYTAISKRQAKLGNTLESGETKWKFSRCVGKLFGAMKLIEASGGEPHSLEAAAEVKFFTSPSEWPRVKQMAINRMLAREGANVAAGRVPFVKPNKGEFKRACMRIGIMPAIVPRGSPLGEAISYVHQQYFGHVTMGEVAQKLMTLVNPHLRLGQAWATIMQAQIMSLDKRLPDKNTLASLNKSVATMLADNHRKHLTIADRETLVQLSSSFGAMVYRKNLESRGVQASVAANLASVHQRSLDPLSKQAVRAQMDSWADADDAEYTGLTEVASELYVDAKEVAANLFLNNRVSETVSKTIADFLHEHFTDPKVYDAMLQRLAQLMIVTGVLHKPVRTFIAQPTARSFAVMASRIFVILVAGGFLKMSNIWILLKRWFNAFVDVTGLIPQEEVTIFDNGVDSVGSASDYPMDWSSIDEDDNWLLRAFKTAWISLNGKVPDSEEEGAEWVAKAHRDATSVNSGGVWSAESRKPTTEEKEADEVIQAINQNKADEGNKAVMSKFLARALAPLDDRDAANYEASAMADEEMSDSSESSSVEHIERCGEEEKTDPVPQIVHTAMPVEQPTVPHPVPETPAQPAQPQPQVAQAEHTGLPALSQIANSEFIDKVNITLLALVLPLGALSTLKVLPAEYADYLQGVRAMFSLPNVLDSVQRLFSTVVTQVVPCILTGDTAYLRPAAPAKRIEAMATMISCSTNRFASVSEMAAAVKAFVGFERFGPQVPLAVAHALTRPVISEMIIWLTQQAGKSPDPTISHYLAALTKAKLHLDAIVEFNRGPPLGILYTGAPGVGKTEAANQVPSVVGPLFGIYPNVCRAGKLSYGKPTIMDVVSEFQDTVTSFCLFLLFNEIPAIKSKPGENPTYALLMSVGEGSLVQINKSHVDAKGTSFYNNLVTIVTSNLENCGATEHVVSPEAFFRRLHFRVHLTKADDCEKLYVKVTRIDLTRSTTALMDTLHKEFPIGPNDDRFAWQIWVNGLLQDYTKNVYLPYLQSYKRQADRSLCEACTANPCMCHLDVPKLDPAVLETIRKSETHAEEMVKPYGDVYASLGTKMRNFIQKLTKRKPTAPEVEALRVDSAVTLDDVMVSKVSSKMSTTLRSRLPSAPNWFTPAIMAAATPRLKLLTIIAGVLAEDLFTLAMFYGSTHSFMVWLIRLAIDAWLNKYANVEVSWFVIQTAMWAAFAMGLSWVMLVHLLYDLVILFPWGAEMGIVLERSMSKVVLSNRVKVHLSKILRDEDTAQGLGELLASPPVEHAIYNTGHTLAVSMKKDIQSLIDKNLRTSMGAMAGLVIGLTTTGAIGLSLFSMWRKSRNAQHTAYGDAPTPDDVQATLDIDTMVKGVRHPTPTGHMGMIWTTYHKEPLVLETGIRKYASKSDCEVVVKWPDGQIKRCRGSHVMSSVTTSKHILSEEGVNIVTVRTSAGNFVTHVNLTEDKGTMYLDVPEAPDHVQLLVQAHPSPYNDIQVWQGSITPGMLIYLAGRLLKVVGFREWMDPRAKRNVLLCELEPMVDEQGNSVNLRGLSGSSAWVVGVPNSSGSIDRIQASLMGFQTAGVQENGVLTNRPLVCQVPGAILLKNLLSTVNQRCTAELTMLSIPSGLTLVSAQHPKNILTNISQEELDNMGGTFLGSVAEMQSVRKRESAFSKTACFDFLNSVFPDILSKFTIPTLRAVKRADGFSSSVIGNIRLMTEAGVMEHQAPFARATRMVALHLIEQLQEYLAILRPGNMHYVLKGSDATVQLNQKSSPGAFNRITLKVSRVVDAVCGTHEEPVLRASVARRVEANLAKLYTGVPIPFFAFANLKDEIVSVSKEEKFLIRLFMAGSLDNLIPCKMFLGPLFEAMARSRDKIHMQVGLNALSDEFESLFKRLFLQIYPDRDFKDMYVMRVWSDSDFEKYDKRIAIVPCGLAVLKQVIHASAHYNENARDMLAIDTLLDSLSTYSFTVDDALVHMTRGQPSGVYTTTVVNSLCESIYEVVQFYFLLYRHFHGQNPTLAVDFVALYCSDYPFDKHVALANYGDDNFKCLSPLACQIYTHDGIMAYANAIHMGITPSQKEETKLELKTAREVLFLKRKLVSTPWGNAGQLALSSIVKSLAYSDSAPEHFHMVKLSAQRELSFYPIEVRQKFIPILGEWDVEAMATSSLHATWVYNEPDNTQYAHVTVAAEHTSTDEFNFDLDLDVDLALIPTIIPTYIFDMLHFMCTICKLNEENHTNIIGKMRTVYEQIDGDETLHMRSVARSVFFGRMHTYCAGEKKRTKSMILAPQNINRFITAWVVGGDDPLAERDFFVVLAHLLTQTTPGALDPFYGWAFAQLKEPFNAPTPDYEAKAITLFFLSIVEKRCAAQVVKDGNSGWRCRIVVHNTQIDFWTYGNTADLAEHWGFTQLLKITKSEYPDSLAFFERLRSEAKVLRHHAGVLNQPINSNS